MKGEIGICKHCKREFTKKMFTQVYCSGECMSRHGIQKAKEKAAGSKFKVLNRDGFKCFYCGKSSIDEDSRLVLDHVIPVTKKGHTGYDNLVTCCTECNSGKSSMVPQPEILETIQAEIIRRNKIHGLK